MLVGGRGPAAGSAWVSGAAHSRRCAHTGVRHGGRPRPAEELLSAGLAARGRWRCGPVPLSTRWVPAPRGPASPPPRPAGQVRRLRRGREAIPGAGAAPGPCAPGRPEKAPLTKGGSVQTPRPRPGRPPPGAGGGRRRRGRRRREPPPPGRPQTPRLAGTRGRLAPPGTGGGRGPTRGAPRARAAGEGRDLRRGGLGGQAPALRPRGDFSVSSTLLCLQLSNLGPEEAGTPARRGGGRAGRLGPGSAPLSTPSVWGEGGVEGRPHEGSQGRALS